MTLTQEANKLLMDLNKLKAEVNSITEGIDMLQKYRLKMDFSR